MDNPLEGALAWMDNRVVISDLFDLAAACAVAISPGHCFKDVNRHTALQTTATCLDLNGVQLMWTAAEVGRIIFAAPRPRMEQAEPGHWLHLRGQSGLQKI